MPPRLSQPGTLRERYPLPPRRPRPLPRWPTRMTSTHQEWGKNQRGKNLDFFLACVPRSGLYRTIRVLPEARDRLLAARGGSARTE